MPHGACSYARIGDYAKALTDYDAAIVFLRRSSAEYGNSAYYQRMLQRMVAERASALELSRGSSPAIQASAFCDEYYRKRERSTLLPPSAGNLPDLRILSDGDRGI